LTVLAGHRQVRFGIDVRPVIGADDDAVEALGRRIMRVAPLWTFGDGASSPDEPRRVLKAMTRADGAASPFVGTVEAIAQRLNEYRAVGVDVFHLRGFDPLNDVDTHNAVIEDVRRLTDADTDRSPIVHHVA
jgi:alkanesulfonate monooxygenase SsuD/methylene tetrahydromethanopterin reductase-like flavin-dependent oxidoreductase (luciferase family)